MKNTTLHQINALWLHVGDGDKELLLSYRNIRAIIPAPVIQRVVPLQSLAAGLIAYRNEIYTAFFLSKLIGNPSGKTDSAGWGLLLEAPGVRLVLLTADFFGLINLKSDKSSFTKHDGNSPPAFMGYAQMAGRNLLLLDPLKLHTLTALRDQGEKQRWYDATNIRPVTVVKRRKSRGVRLVLLADGGHVFALPLKSLFNVRRVMSGNTSTPRLCERLGKSVDSQTRFSSKNPNNTPLVNTDETADWRSGFTCTIRGIQTEVDVRFEALLESIEVMDRQISTWAGMSFLTLKGAFMHTSNKTVFVVDTERLATGGRTVA
ncbi:MAG: chemotaxis protein CheW, partial [Desulfobacteraceae bacterium]